MELKRAFDKLFKEEPYGKCEICGKDLTRQQGEVGLSPGITQINIMHRRSIVGNYDVFHCGDCKHNTIYFDKWSNPANTPIHWVWYLIGEVWRIYRKKGHRRLREGTQR